MKDFWSIILSAHAQKRMQQRAITEEQIKQALLWGDESYKKRGKVYQYSVGYRACKEASRKGVDISSCHGLVVISAPVDRGDLIVTVWWDRSPNRYQNKRMYAFQVGA